MTLIANGGCSRVELAKRYELSERTVRRYIDAMVEAGVPVAALPGRGGGYRIEADYRLGGALLTEAELERIRLGLEALSETFPVAQSDEILGKLTCVTEYGEKPSVPRFYVDSDSWHSDGGMSFKVGTVGAAVGNRQTIAVTYTDKNGKSTERRIDPYSLAFKEGVWYVYGWCHTYEEFRLFRLARIRNLEVTDRRFRTRSGGDLRAALSVDLGSKVAVELEAEERALPRLEEWLGESCVERRGNRYFCRAEVWDGPDLVNRILSFGLSVRVLSPKPLADRVAADAKRIAASYASLSPHADFSENSEDI